MVIKWLAGWHYGFKLHASINPRGELCGLHFTPASFHDAQSLPYLIKGKAKIVVGDGTYNARVMRERLWRESGVFVLAPAHPKQTKKLMNKWQKGLLEARPKIESVFDILKEHCHLVTYSIIYAFYLVISFLKPCPDFRNSR